jgi:hypothetical protein
MGFGLVNRFTGHLYTPLVTTSNYNTIANPYILQITRAHTKSSQFAFTSRFLVMNLNNGHSSASALTSLLSGEYPANELTLWLCPLLITSQHGPCRNTLFPLLQSNCCIIKNLLPSNGNVFTELLPRNRICTSAHLTIIA